MLTGVPVIGRILLQPLQPYGDGAAQYIEHVVRVELVELLRSAEGGALSKITLADQTVLSHPPGLHLFTGLLGEFTGQNAGAVLWTGLLWLVLLALASGDLARSLGASTNSARFVTLATAFLPAAQGAASRYHYDLPMTALLWLASALFARALLSQAARRGLGLALGSALLFVAACLVKWTAIPYGLMMCLGLAFSAPALARPPKLARSVLISGLTLVLASALILGFLCFVSSESFRAGQLAGEEGGLGALGLPWYVIGFVTSVISPLGLMILAWPAWLGLRKRRRTWPFLLGAGLGQLAFLLVFVSRPDERFLLTLAPCLVLTAGFGFDELAAKTGRRLLLVALGLPGFVSLEFHLAPEHPLAPIRTIHIAGPEGPPLQTRGLFLADSFEQRGWGARSTTRSNEDDLRRALGQDLFALGPPDLLAVEVGISERGDVWWLRYISSLARLEGRAEGRLTILGPVQLGDRSFWWPMPDTRTDAPLFYRHLGFDRDWMSDHDGNVTMDSTDPRLGPGVFDHFRPCFGLARLGREQSSIIDERWTVERRYQLSNGEELGLYVAPPMDCAKP